MGLVMMTDSSRCRWSHHPFLCQLQWLTENELCQMLQISRQCFLNVSSLKELNQWLLLPLILLHGSPLRNCKWSSYTVLLLKYYFLDSRMLSLLAGNFNLLSDSFHFTAPAVGEQHLSISIWPTKLHCQIYAENVCLMESKACVHLGGFQKGLLLHSA